MKFVSLLFCLVVGSASAFSGAIEDWVENSPQPDAVQEWLDDLREHPADLNRMSRDELLRLPFFDELTAQRLLDARDKSGNFLQMEDVLRLSDWSEEQREVLRRFTTVRSREEHARIRATSQFSESASSSLRGTFSTDNRTSGFVAARQDESKPQALQDVSVGLAYRRTDLGLQVVAGDFQFESGSGLIFGSSYGSASWLSRGNSLIPARASGLKSKPTSDRLSQFRGAGFQFNRGMVQGAAIVSQQQLDAIATDEGITRIAEGESVIPATAAARDNRLTEQLLGGEFSAQYYRWQVSLSGARSQFTPELVPEPDPDQPFALRGRRLDVGGVTFSGSFRQFEFMAEAAGSNPGGEAVRAVVAVQRDAMGLSFYHSYASPDFYSLHSKAWSSFGDDAENTRRTGVRLRYVSSGHVFGLHAWTSRTPFRTASLPLSKSSGGVELRSDLPVISNVSAELLASRSWNENSGLESAEISTQTDRARLEMTLSQRIEFKLRLELRAVKSDADRDSQHGSLLFVQTKYPNRIATLLLRIAFFDSESGSSAIRAYEATPMGAFPIVTYSRGGRRVTGMISRSIGPLAFALKLADLRDDRGESFDGAVQVSINW